MARYKEIELTNGMKVRVYVPPTQRIMAMVEEKYPKPPKPVPPVVTEKTVTGREQVMSIDDDPTYLSELARWNGKDLVEWQALTSEEIDRRNSLFVFKGLKVPDDWDVESEVGEIVRLDEPDWKPTPGEQGRKRDYIQWELLNNPQDALLVQQTLAELSGFNLKEVHANEASFQTEMEGRAD